MSKETIEDKENMRSNIEDTPKIRFLGLANYSNVNKTTNESSQGSQPTISQGNNLTNLKRANIRNMKAQEIINGALANKKIKLAKIVSAKVFKPIILVHTPQGSANSTPKNMFGPSPPNANHSKFKQDVTTACGTPASILQRKGRALVVKDNYTFEEMVAQYDGKIKVKYPKEPAQIINRCSLPLL